MKRVGFVALMLFLSGQVLAEGDFQKGISYYKQQQYEKAIAEFKQLVEANPDYENGYRILGKCYLETKNYGEAVTAFEKALELKKDTFVSHHGLGIAYYNKGNYREAIAALLKAERFVRSPRDRYEVYHARGSAYFNSGDFERAVSDLEKAVFIKRGELVDVLELGMALYQVKNHSGAESYLKQALALDPESKDAQRYLARIEFEQAVQSLEEGQYRKAADLLNSYVRDKSEDGQAWFNLGLAHLFLEELKASEEAFLRSEKLLPDQWEVYGRLGYIYEKMKLFDKALQNYKKAHQLHPGGELQASVERIEERIRRGKRVG